MTETKVVVSEPSEEKSVGRIILSEKKDLSNSGFHEMREAVGQLRNCQLARRFSGQLIELILHT